MEICVITLGKDWITGSSYMKNTWSTLRKWLPLHSSFWFHSHALCFSFWSFVLYAEGCRPHNGSLLDESSGSSATRLHSARSWTCSSFGRGLAHANGFHERNLLTSGKSAYQVLRLFPHFFQEIIPQTGSEISQWYIYPHKYILWSR